MVYTLLPARKTNINNNKLLNKRGFQASVRFIMTPHAKVVKLNSKKKSCKSLMNLPYEKYQLKLIHI